MIATFTALLCAHALADFVLQTRWMVDHKRHPGVLILHAAVVLLTAQATTGQPAHPAVLALAAVHLGIDLVKTYGLPPGLRAFLADQAAHLASLVAVAWLVPGLWATGAWGGCPGLLPVLAGLAGLILATRAGAFAVGLLMAPWSETDLPKGLENGGALIGLLERGLIFLLVLVGQPAGVGFLIAAKSVLRFETTSRDQRAGEYVIIGTLASFGWALVAAYATQGLLDVLPPLEIGRPAP